MDIDPSCQNEEALVDTVTIVITKAHTHKLPLTFLSEVESCDSHPPLIGRQPSGTIYCVKQTIYHLLQSHCIQAFAELPVNAKLSALPIPFEMSAIVERRTRKRYKAAAASGLVAAVYGAVSWADTLPFLSATIWMTIIFSPAVMGLIAVIRIAPDVGGKALHLLCLSFLR